MKMKSIFWGIIMLMLISLVLMGCPSNGQSENTAAGDPNEEVLEGEEDLEDEINLDSLEQVEEKAELEEEALEEESLKEDDGL